MLICFFVYLFIFISADHQINGCSLDKAEERAKRDMEVKTTERAFTEEHINYVNGMDQSCTICLHLLLYIHCNECMKVFNIFLYLTLYTMSIKM